MILWYIYRYRNMCTSRWRHQMETFSALLAICVGNSPLTGEFPAQRPVMRSFDVFFHLRLNKWLSKQSWGCWFGTPSRSLWRHPYDFCVKLLQHLTASSRRNLKNDEAKYVFIWIKRLPTIYAVYFLHKLEKIICSRVSFLYRMEYVSKFNYITTVLLKLQTWVFNLTPLFHHRKPKEVI